MYTEIPVLKLFICELSVIVEVREGEGLLGHSVSLTASEARRDQQSREECLCVSSDPFSSNY